MALRRVYAVVLLAGCLCACQSQPVQTGTSLHPWEEDRAYMQDLEQHGVVEAGRHTVAWFPSNTLDPAQIAAIVARLDHGIGAAKQYIGKPQWAFRGDSRVYFYFPDARFVSHAPGGNTVLIPWWRIRDDQAPWLHEALHLLLAPAGGDWLATPGNIAAARMPLWLHEGLAESLAMDIAAEEGLVHYSPLIDVPAARLDALCKSRLRHASSDRVLASIGGRGKLPELFGPNRVSYALPFYTCSTSFVRHLGTRYGKGPLLRAIGAFDQEIEVLQQDMARSLAEVKEDWLKEVTAI